MWSHFGYIKPPSRNWGPDYSYQDLRDWERVRYISETPFKELYHSHCWNKFQTFGACTCWRQATGLGSMTILTRLLYSCWFALESYKCCSRYFQELRHVDKGKTTEPPTQPNHMPGQTVTEVPLQLPPAHGGSPSGPLAQGFAPPQDVEILILTVEVCRSNTIFFRGCLLERFEEPSQEHPRAN